MSLMKKVMETVVRFLPEPIDDPMRDQQGLVGQPVPRADGALKVMGEATFAAEYKFANMAYAAVAHSSISKGRIRAIDSSASEKLPGVIKIVTHLNAPKLADPPPFNTSGGQGGAAGSSHPILQSERISYNGEPVALVIAESVEQAEEAVALLRIDYQAEPAEVDFLAGRKSAKNPDSLLGEPVEVKRGDAEKALQQAAFKVDNLYHTPGEYHTAIEPHASVAVWVEDKLVVYEAAQMVYLFRDTLAAVFGLAKEQVRVISPFVGGGFGSKGLWSNSVLCALAARETGRPVQLVLPRRGVFQLVGGRTPTEQRVAIGCDRNGHFQSLIHSGYSVSTPYNDFPEPFTFPARHLYATDNLWVGQKIVHLDVQANTFMRAPGECPGTFALESAIDELAHELGMDPVELRRLNEPERDPAKDTQFSHRALLSAYAQGAQAFAWKHRSPRSQSQGNWWVGQGVATALYPYYRYPATARIRLTQDGQAVVQTAAHEMGMGTATVQIQHAAQRLALPLDQVAFEYGDSLLPEAPMAGGSNQSASLIAAVMAAVDELHTQLLQLAPKDSPLHGKKLADVEARQRGLYLKSDSSQGLSYIELLRTSAKDQLEVEASSAPPLEFMQYSMHSYGAQFAEVHVHKSTGEVRVTRFLGSFDCGRILNRKTAESQFRGGIVMGIGMALSEEGLFDARYGRVVNASLAEYHVPVNLDVPHIDILTTDIPDPHAPLGVHGIGEIGITGVAAAIANAVFNATGKRIRDLPITLDKLM